MTHEKRVVIGIDVGGTFTDAVVLDQHRGSLLQAFKIPSTPGDPKRAVLDALALIERQGADIGGAIVCHGTTVGTNTLIERKGARTALLTTRGFKDVIELRRQSRPLLYSLDIEVSEPLVDAADRYEVDERVAADGSVVVPLRDTESLMASLRAKGAQAVVVSLLHAYANPEHEIALVRALERALPGAFVTRSSDVCPEFREYERTSTAVINAYIGPAISRYVRGLKSEATKRGIDHLLIVKSSGGLTSPDNAARYPVHLIESGPAAGLIAAAAFAAAGRKRNLIAFDMGGTTAKAGVIRDGRPRVTNEFYADRLVAGKDVGGYPIRSSVLDLVEIGAGGGSLAQIDEAGVLKVGPKSAGAVPGPACYGRGGERPTVTDAHAVIGTLSAANFEGSGIAFDATRAQTAIEADIAQPLGWSVARAAYAIIDIAVANMAEMVRLATVRRGLDPRDFAILASGGAGPLHAAAVGDEVGASEVIVPPLPGMFSALGAALGDIRHEVVQTVLCAVRDMQPETLPGVFASLRQRGAALFAAEPAGHGEPHYARFAEIRFQGQLFELRVPLGDADKPLPTPVEIELIFREQYRNEYGFDLPDAVAQLVNLRLELTLSLGISAARLLEEPEGATQVGVRPTRVEKVLSRDGGTTSLPVIRAAGALGTMIAGPALIEHAGSTVWIHPGHRAEIGRSGRVLIHLSRSGRT